MLLHERLVHRFLHGYVELRPEQATTLGVPDNDSRLNDNRPEALKHYQTFLTAIQTELAELDPAQLSATQVVDSKLLALAIKAEQLDLNQLARPQTDPAFYLPIASLFGLIERAGLPFERRFESLLARLGEVPDSLGLAREALTRPSATHCRYAVQEIQGGIALLHSLPKLLASGARHVPWGGERLNDAIAVAQTALQSFQTWLEESLGSAHTDHPFTPDLYLLLLSDKFGIETDPMHSLTRAQSLLQSSQTALCRAASELGHQDWTQALRELRQEQPTQQSIQDRYRDALRDMHRMVDKHDLVSLPGDAKLHVVGTPRFMQAHITSVGYRSVATFAEEDLGFFYVTGQDSDSTNSSDQTHHAASAIRQRACRLGFPGAHVQSVLAKRHTSPLRVSFAVSGFSEAWSAYSDTLLAELVTLTAKEQVWLHYESLVRSARVIADVSLHTDTKSRDETFEFLSETLALDPQGTQLELDKLMLQPGKPVSVQAILDEIQTQRRQFEARQPATKLRIFHDHLLSEGALSPQLLAESLPYTEKMQ